MEKSSVKLAPWAVLLLVLSFAAIPTTLSQCGYNNCTNFFKACNTKSDINGGCICVPFGGKFGACIYRGLIRQDLTYCISHSECIRKGTGNFCMKSAGSGFGWCLARGESGSLRLPA